jgi:hypothetical protein
MTMMYLSPLWTGKSKIKVQCLLRALFLAFRERERERNLFSFSSFYNGSDGGDSTLRASHKSNQLLLLTVRISVHL